MLKLISKIGLMAFPAFMACHLINENDDVQKYCPFVKYKNSESKDSKKSKKSLPTSSSSNYK